MKRKRLNHPHTPATSEVMVSWSCCHPLSHPIVLRVIIKGIKTDNQSAIQKPYEKIGHPPRSILVLQSNVELEICFI